LGIPPNLCGTAIPWPSRLPSGYAHTNPRTPARASGQTGCQRWGAHLPRPPRGRRRRPFGEPQGDGVFEDLALPSLLKSLDPKARDELRRLLVRDLIDFLFAPQGGTAEGAAAARPDRGCRAALGRTGQAGERRGTRPSFASLGNA
jgi:hypothetical protein